mmetsp:Transcript_20460/g.44314  ORF Transcript_20460/g.44314 Transcript_20460/m.44314 type:complete len:188 (-) Transcript_20460:108-671(-)
MCAATKKSWIIFWDLQCPYSRKNWEQFSAIKDRLGDEYDFSIHLTSLLLHPQAFPAQCAANLIANKSKGGAQAKMNFINACFRQQDLYRNAAVPDARPSEIDAIFATIAQGCGVLDSDDGEGDFTNDFFLANLHDWDLAVKPAWAEHKEALALGVVGTPSHVIEGKIVQGTESSWGPEEWAEKVKTL